ncbi:putative serine/threonine-protein kinase PLK4 [Apostichopus japonicus]|uniref:Putative serine/threonine-protein kinase PLK4 n=1 Tax=Stichopus japonicus TaxID=307972 RepID=A0A2G8KNX3_STIJA|nr:putative serine/threonine-protein kinase PLK4 [Apostichopus japonicus]
MKHSNYEVSGLLGRGGFACVYRAKSINTCQEVAIKMIDKKKMKASGMVSRVRNEVEIPLSAEASVNSREVLCIAYNSLQPKVYQLFFQLYSYFEDENYVYLVLEMCRNGELHTYLKTNHKLLSEGEAAHFLKEIVLGLLYLHSHGILHRDLTLANMLLTEDMHCDYPLRDFGPPVHGEAFQQFCRGREQGRPPAVRNVGSSHDSGHATMATSSTAATAPTRPSSRSRPMRALPLPSLTPIISEDEQNLIPATHSALGDLQSGNREDVRWRDPYQRHPPSPPVRERDYFHTQDEQRRPKELNPGNKTENDLAAKTHSFSRISRRRTMFITKIITMVTPVPHPRESDCIQTVTRNLQDSGRTTAGLPSHGRESPI